VNFYCCVHKCTKGCISVLVNSIFYKKSYEIVRIKLVKHIKTVVSFSFIELSLNEKTHISMCKQNYFSLTYFFIHGKECF
jgi:hypothetical protein